MNIIAMIPARYNASRFPGKLMKDLGGKPVIVRTYEAALQAKLFDKVYVVTDSEVIKTAIETVNGDVIMSTKEHECGSDRIAEAVTDLNVDIVVNVQGDEPFIDTVSLRKLIDVFHEDPERQIDLASLKVQITDIEAIENPNNVKVITDSNGFAIYFSRSVIPYPRAKELNTKYYKHKGVYAFRKEALLNFYHTPMTPLEAAEKIECIRYLEAGKKIKMIETEVESIGIDTPEDLEKRNITFSNMINKEKIKVIAFDADDTLWVNETYFREAENQFASLLSAYETENKIHQELFKAEIRNLPLYGYGIKGFTLSMIECALELSNQQLPPKILNQILEIGKDMLEKPVVLLEGVITVLEALKDQYKLIVATKGDLLDQEKKLAKSGLLHYFHHIEVMSEKKENDYQKLLNHLDIAPEAFLMIGNSLKSDVLPILSIGGSAIHVPFHTTWQFEEVKKTPADVQYPTLNNITEITALL